MGDLTATMATNGHLLEHLIVLQDRSAFFELMIPLLEPLRRHAAHELSIATADGDLGEGEMTVTDVVDEVVALAYDRFADRGHPIDRWLIRLLHECVDRREFECRQASSLTDELPLTDPRGEPDDAWIVENESLWTEPDSVRLEDAVTDRSAVDPMQAAADEDERQWLLAQLLSFARPMRRAFVLHSIEGWTPAEVAALQDRPERDVVADIEAVRKSMRSRFPA